MILRFLRSCFSEWVFVFVCDLFILYFIVGVINRFWLVFRFSFKDLEQYPLSAMMVMSR